jgi:O-antigen/teichoic acid export membrane protein
MAGYALGQGIRFGSNLVMTRLLVPEMWGVLSLALVFMYGLGMFTDIGLGQAAVQSKRGGKASFLNTVWVVKIVTGVTMTIGMFLVATAIAVAAHFELFPAGSTYAAPELPYVIAAIGATALISGFESTKVYEATRYLSLGRITQMGVFTQVVALASMLLASMVTRSIWVLVTGAVVGAVLGVVMSHVWLRGTRNRLQWDRAEFTEILRFGKWILGSSSISFLSVSMDRLILGAVVPAATMGLYAIAGLLYGAIEQVVSKIVSQVSFPAFSEVARERVGDLRRTVYKFHTPIGLIAYGMTGFLVVAAPAVVRILYDSRYEDAGWMLRIMVMGMLAIPAKVHAACLLSLGYSRIPFLQAVAAFAVTAVAIPLGFFFFGIAGAIAGVLAAQLSGVPIALFYSARHGIVNVSRELAVLVAAPTGALAGYVFNVTVGRLAQ